MCLSRPKMPKASTVMQAPPMPPPPPTETADEVINKADKDRRMKKRRGTSDLTIRRNTSISTPTSGAGSNVPY
jgi:type IV secretory pathway VirB10-like protein